MTIRERKLGAATRDAYGKALLELGNRSDKIVVLDADLSKSTKTIDFAKAYPERFLNVGIAEANLVGMAAGLAGSGLVPFASSFASFLMTKGFDQLRMGVANPHVNAKFVGSHGGVSLGEDGASQMSVEDVALAVALPGFAVLVPSDAIATRELTYAIAAHVGPVFMRTGRPKAPILYQEGETFKVGGSHTLQKGKDATIVACGLMVFEALQAADMALEAGYSVGVIDAYSIKPLDAAAVIEAARESGALLVAEEHLKAGGLGAAIAQVVGENYPVPLGFVGLDDRYAGSGTPEAVMEACGLTAGHLFEAVKGLLERKQRLAKVLA